ncbi:olfactory receptor 1L4-like [Mantella aurantiaca]
METTQNKTFSGFILLGFSDVPHLLLPLFSFFLVVYVLCIAGNSFMIMLIVSQPPLRSTMYTLIGNLAFVDLCFTSTIVPRSLYSLLSRDTHISRHDCFIQLFLFLAVASMDGFLLAIMAFDRYCAVCLPLRYLVIMNNRTCISLLAHSWVIAFLQSTFYTVLTSAQSFCSWVIHHFFCDIPVLMKLACLEISGALRIVVYAIISLVLLGPVFIIFGSYVLIVRAVLALQTSQGRWKTFSTCSSHLTIVILQYSTMIFMYFRPNSIYSSTYDRVISVVYSIINPTLNPFIYSLRNKDVKTAVRRILK